MTFSKIYSCLPLKNFQISRFQFENGQLNLTDEEEAAEFEAIINGKNFPAVDRVRIKTINLAAAEKLVAAATPRATQGMDQGINKELAGVKALTPKVGTDDIGTKEGGNS
jgi:hypothetical protein